MITLTTPPAINTILGGNPPVDYDKLVIAPFTMHPIDQTVTAQIRLSSTVTPSMQAITGTLRISVTASELLIEVAQLDFYRRIVLSGAQKNALLANIETAQAALENGLVSLGVIAGVRTAGV